MNDNIRTVLTRQQWTSYNKTSSN